MQDEIQYTTQEKDFKKSMINNWMIFTKPSMKTLNSNCTKQCQTVYFISSKYFKWDKLTKFKHRQTTEVLLEARLICS